MKEIVRLSILFMFLLVFIVPIFAQEETEVTTEVSEEEVLSLEEAEEGVITGRVTSLDADVGIISVKDEEGVEKIFSVVSGETILWKGIEDIELADISEGEEAEVGYYADEGGKLIASWVDVLIEEEIIPTEPALEELELEEGEEEEESSLE